MLVLAVIVLSAVALEVYIAPLLPIVVALVTKASAPEALKAGVLAFLALVTALVAPAVQNGASITLDGAFLGRFVVALVIAIAAHYGLGKPLGITGSQGVVAQKVPGGIG